eukprot:scaffold301_cov370-Pavlova_lutheri.AAC.18
MPLRRSNAPPLSWVPLSFYPDQPRVNIRFRTQAWTPVDRGSIGNEPLGGVPERDVLPVPNERVVGGRRKESVHASKGSAVSDR